MSSTSYYCRPEDNLTPSSTPSLQVGVADAAFPLVNIKDRLAKTVFKSTGTNCKIRLTFGAPVTLEAVAFHFHNWAGGSVTVTNAAGFSNALAIPANRPDGHCVDPWDDYRGLSLVTSDVWEFDITVLSGVVSLGELVCIQTLRELVLAHGSGGGNHQPAIVHGTDYHPQAMVYPMGTRVRSFQGHIVPADTADDALWLHESARGPLTAFTVIPDSTKNDALLAQLVDQKQDYVDTMPRGGGAREVPIRFIESIRGLSL